MDMVQYRISSAVCFPQHDPQQDRKRPFRCITHLIPIMRQDGKSITYLPGGTREN
jgi:hypothetical protein